MMIISVRDLTLRYGGTKGPLTLKKVDLAINRGEFVAIRGSSGSGKSTLLYILGGLLERESGRLTICGQDPDTLSKEELSFFRNEKVGFVFQQFHLLARATVLENILLPSQYPTEASLSSEESRIYRERATQLARRMGLAEHLHKRPNELSGGQQQRVAIARALLKNPELILADEPTGNLDSQTSLEILALFKKLNQEGCTIVLITHDHEVASAASRSLEMRDGVLEDPRSSAVEALLDPLPLRRPHRTRALALKLAPVAWENLWRNKGRSILTMLGVTIGVAAVLSMITVGQYAKTKILESYEVMGVNKLFLYAYPSWRQRAQDTTRAQFYALDWERDLVPLKRIFPEIDRIAPVQRSWGGAISYGGKSIKNDVYVLGTSLDGLITARRTVSQGRPFTPFDVENRSSVCLLGSDLVQPLFGNTSPIGNIVQLSTRSEPNKMGCRVIGVLSATRSNKEWDKPNSAVIIPHTTYASFAENRWEIALHNVLIQAKMGTDMETLSAGIKNFFISKYDKSGEFNVDSDDIMVSQLKKFLAVFTVLLASIASLSLLIGGMGITNMMLVSVSERLREIGLRKALGATPKSIRLQFLTESTALCGIAGLLGLLLGFGGYEGLLYLASKFNSKVQFEWIVHPGAFLLSIVAIGIVGILSGLIPALKAEKLQVIEALRTE